MDVHLAWSYLLALKLTCAEREIKERGGGKGKDEEDGKPILLETHSTQTFVPALHQNFLCQGHSDLHNEQVSVFIQQSDFSPSFLKHLLHLGLRAHILLFFLLPHW